MQEKTCAMCDDCIHRHYCASYGDDGIIDCLVFEPEDKWEEMSYCTFAPKTMQQRLREGE